MISHKYKCIFIHIQKTAGSSIEQKLGLFSQLKYGVQDHRPIRALRPRNFFGFIPLLFRSTPDFSRKQFLLKPFNNHFYPSGELTQRQFDSYFKFTVVRNPWDRAHSWYRHICKFEQLRLDYGLPECSFADFLLQYKGRNGLMPQTWYVRDYDGTLLVDEIFRFERISDELPVIAERLGLEDAEFPKNLETTPVDYRLHYDSELIKAIEEQFHDDIHTFGYSFE